MSNILSIGVHRRELDVDRKRRDLLQRLQSLWGSGGAVASAILDLVEVQNEITDYFELYVNLDGPEPVNKDWLRLRSKSGTLPVQS